MDATSFIWTTCAYCNPANQVHVANTQFRLPILDPTMFVFLALLSSISTSRSLVPGEEGVRTLFIGKAHVGTVKKVYCFCFGTGSTIIAMQAHPNPAHFGLYLNSPEKSLFKDGTMAELDEALYTCERDRWIFSPGLVEVGRPYLTSPPTSAQKKKSSRLFQPRIPQPPRYLDPKGMPLKGYWEKFVSFITFRQHPPCNPTKGWFAYVFHQFIIPCPDSFRTRFDL